LTIKLVYSVLVRILSYWFILVCALAEQKSAPKTAYLEPKGPESKLHVHLVHFSSHVYESNGRFDIAAEQSSHSDTV